MTNILPGSRAPARSEARRSMAGKSSRRSNASLISVDPAVAKHIRSTSHDPNASAQSRTKAKKGSDVERKEERKVTRTQSARRAAAKSRSSTSLRRVKDGGEVMRQRPIAPPEIMVDADSAKEGRNFTVGNVGTGGMIYLRPSANRRPHTSPFTLPASGDESAVDGKENTSPNPHLSVWSDSQRSDNIQAPVVRSASTIGKRSKKPSTATSHIRSRSFSTVDETRKSDRGTLRIVIDRAPPQRPATTPAPVMPTLQVPIPHYKLGRPRFSPHGTADLRSSQYSRTSDITSETRASSFAKPHLLFPAPPGTTFAITSIVSTPQFGSNSSAADRTSSQGASVAMYGANRPVQPAIFDDLARRIDDPAVVRYSQRTGEVTAATSIRLVVQITSESFMDYDLVSDFFLTFRSYLATGDLLDILLARLRWAISRMSDDGRIIRIRTFAALRHWTLNYFVDDFVEDLGLRTKFCDGINDLCFDVKAQTIGNLSDLKILQDLKRCWNGRCLLCYGFPPAITDVSQTNDIQPGGIVEQLEQSGAAFDTHLGLTPREAQVSSTLSWFDKSPANYLEWADSRPAPTLSTGVPGPVSEQSLQPNSCSLPLAVRSPVVASGRGKISPPTLAWPIPKKGSLDGDEDVQTKPVHSHKPSGSFADSLRQSRDSKAVLLQGSSVIRGQFYQPPPPFINVITPVPVPKQQIRFDLAEAEVASASTDSLDFPSPSCPPTKSMIGSIRRALTGKHSISLPINTTQSDRLLRGKTSALPLNVAKSHDNMRSQTPATRTQLRIDLLCAAVAQSYQNARSAVSRSEGLNFGDSDSYHNNSKPHRLDSQATAQSGSILIADDTGLGIDIPMMSGALPAGDHTRRQLREDDEKTGQQTVMLRSAWLAQANKARSQDFKPGDPGNSDAPAFQTSMSEENDGSSSTGASSTTVRAKDSYPKSNRTQQTPSLDDTVTTLSESHVGESDDIVPVPSQLLRRRPGGDLKKTTNVHDLEAALRHDSIQRSSNDTDSLLILSNSPGSSRQPPVPHPISLINTHSSQHLRPSFEAAVSGFSAIPDDDDGGLEATLLKLEGKFEKSSPTIVQAPFGPGESSRQVLRDLNQEKLVHRKETAQKDAISMVIAGIAELPTAVSPVRGNQATGGQDTAFGLSTPSIAKSDDSYSSVPLLQRGLSDDSMAIGKNPAIRGIATRFVDPRPETNASGSSTSHPSIEIVEKTASIDNIPRGATMPAPQKNSSDRSFLLDEGENLSDLSSELSVDVIDYFDVHDRSVSPMVAAPGTALSGLEIPSHPLAHSPVQSVFLTRVVPPPPPITPPLFQQMPPNPTTSQSQKVQDSNMKALATLLPSNSAYTQTGAQVSTNQAHIPFVLACDAELLAQQFTLVEKAALSEVDWNDLVEMRWDSKSADVLNWVDYLSTSGDRGIDLVTTRFNLVVKWVLSQIVLTQDIHERARAIVKFIHVAAHARRLHNYATMLQLTIALTSVDCTRLRRTWDLVPSPERSLLKTMEALVQPIRNFHDLRDEMESADLTNGCIPFVGLYVHDLTYNSQKPAFVEGRTPNERLVNFERFRTTATIVKGLLRLIDASSKYEFPPIEGIIERCLWLAALSDDRIRLMSRALE